MSLHQLLQESELAKKLDFSRTVHDTHGDIKLTLPMDEVQSIYEVLDDAMQSISPNFDFIQKGISTIKTALSKKNDIYHLSANVAYRLREICEQQGVEAPAWLPIVTRKEASGASARRYLFLFDWSTVKASTIPELYNGYFCMRLRSEIEPCDQSPRNTVLSAKLASRKTDLTKSLNTVFSFLVST